MPSETILVIEDDPDIRELLEYNLEREGYRILTAKSGEKGLEQATNKLPALIMLDLMLPGIDGLEVCRRLKRSDDTTGIPLIMLTAKGEESDVVLGFELGADDYITKPFSPRELVARVRAVLRRGQHPEPELTTSRRELGDIVIDSSRYELIVAGSPVDLTLTEFRICEALASRPGRVFTRSQILDKMTDGEGFISDRNVDVHVRSIRKKLAEHKDVIATVRGIGYKWKD